MLVVFAAAKGYHTKVGWPNFREASEAPQLRGRGDVSNMLHWQHDLPHTTKRAKISPYKQRKNGNIGKIFT